MSNPIPSDTEHRVHVAVVAVAALVALLMIGAAAWAVTRPKPVSEPPQSVTTPTAETSGTGTVTTTTASVGTSTSAEPSSTASPSSTSSSAPVTAAAAGPNYQLAYHRSGTLVLATASTKTSTSTYVTGENYSLSPDGSMIAAVQDGQLLVAGAGEHRTATTRIAPGLFAERVTPVWLPDSASVLFVRPGTNGAPHVWRFSRISATARDLGAGGGMAVSPNGRAIVTMPAEGSTSTALTVWGADGVARAVPVPAGDPVALAASNSRIFVSTLASDGDSEIWSMAMDGSGAKRLVQSGSAGELAATFGELMLSPDSSQLLYAADGDDDYSRLWVVPAAGGNPHEISGRRDGYALRWSESGKTIYFIEGNSYQGQKTALYSCDASGNRRKLLVSGADI